MNEEYMAMMKAQLEALNSSMKRIADGIEKLESKGILVWIGEQKPEEN